jgi:hypothetical protein
MLHRYSVVALASVLAAGCGGGSAVPRYYPVPENAQNPIVMRYSGATVEEIVNIVAQMCAGVPISTAQVVPANGYVETRWSDVGSFGFLGTQASNYPQRERFVIYAFQVRPTSEREGTLQIAGWYQPTAPGGVARTRDSRYDRFIPPDHPGYQLMLSFEWRLGNESFPAAGVTVLPPQAEEGQ